MQRLIRATSAVLITVLVAAVATRAQASPANHDPPPPHWLAGSVATNRTITAASPGPRYVLFGDLTVETGATLTIEPGVEIVALSNADFLAAGDPTRSEIVVKGMLLAQGTETNPIILRDSLGLTGSWGGLSISNGTARLSNLRIERALRMAYVFQSTFNADRVVVQHVATGLDMAQLGTAFPCSLSNSSISYADAGAVARGAVFVADTIVEVGNGILGTPAVVRECILSGRSSPGSIGLTMLNVDMVPSDTMGTVQPVRISRFDVGVEFQGGTLRNSLIVENGTGVQKPGGLPATIDYCTIAGNSGRGIVPSGTQSVFQLRNSILSNNAIVSANYGLTSYGHSVNWMPCGILASSSSSAFGPVSCFDPDFNLGADYRLSATSLFTDYSYSGGHIGAYGPALSLVTGVEGVAVREAAVTGGRVKVVWGGLAPRSEVTAWRREALPTWQSRGWIMTDASGAATFEEEFPSGVVAAQYGISLDGQSDRMFASVWVTPNGDPEVSLRVSPNPLSSRGQIQLTLAQRARARIEILDVMGRRVGTPLAGAWLDPGNHTIDLALAAPTGIYFIRAEVGGQAMARRFVFLN